MSELRQLLDTRLLFFCEHSIRKTVIGSSPFIRYPRVQTIWKLHKAKKKNNNNNNNNNIWHVLAQRRKEHSKSILIWSKTWQQASPWVAVFG